MCLLYLGARMMNLHQLLIRTALLARDIEQPSSVFTTTLNQLSRTHGMGKDHTQLVQRMLTSYSLKDVGRFYFSPPPGDISTFIRDHDLQANPADEARARGEPVKDSLAYNRDQLFTMALNASTPGILELFAIVEDFFVRRKAKSAGVH